MSGTRFPPTDPREWLNRARSNLVQASAGARLAEIYLEDLCFQAQQAAEKALKAVLIALNLRFPYTHDLATLLSLLEQAGEPVPAQLREAARLSGYAVVARYPGVTEPVTLDSRSMKAPFPWRQRSWVGPNGCLLCAPSPLRTLPSRRKRSDSRSAGLAPLPL